MALSFPPLVAPRERTRLFAHGPSSEFIRQGAAAVATRPCLSPDWPLARPRGYGLVSFASAKRAPLPPRLCPGTFHCTDPAWVTDSAAAMAPALVPVALPPVVPPLMVLPPHSAPPPWGLAAPCPGLCLPGCGWPANPEGGIRGTGRRPTTAADPGSGLLLPPFGLAEHGQVRAATRALWLAGAGGFPEPPGGCCLTD